MCPVRAVIPEDTRGKRSRAGACGTNSPGMQRAKGEDPGKSSQHFTGGGEHLKSTRRCPILLCQPSDSGWATLRARPAPVLLIDPVVHMPTTKTTETDRNQSPTPVGINQLLRPELVRIGLPGTSKSEVIDALVDVLAGHEAIDSLKAVRTAIFEREQKMSTGVGKGLGLPHAKTPAASDTVAAFATTEEPVDFGAIDDRPVQLLLLLVGPEEHKSRHVKILGRISRLVSRDSLRHRLIEAETPESVIETLREGEATLRD